MIVPGPNSIPSPSTSSKLSARDGQHDLVERMMMRLPALHRRLDAVEREQHVVAAKAGAHHGAAEQLDRGQFRPLEHLAADVSVTVNSPSPIPFCVRARLSGGGCRCAEPAGAGRLHVDDVARLHRRLAVAVPWRAVDEETSGGSRLAARKACGAECGAGRRGVEEPGEPGAHAELDDLPVAAAAAALRRPIPAATRGDGTRSASPFRAPRSGVAPMPVG